MSHSRTAVLFVATAAFVLVAAGCRADDRAGAAHHHPTPAATASPSPSDSDTPSPTPAATTAPPTPVAAVTSAVPPPPQVHVPAPAAKPAPAPARTTPAASVYYANCTAVRAAGKAPLYRGQPGYRAPLDRDNDGVACE
jgi:type IV secretory pathway VirB10-like protein